MNDPALLELFTCLRKAGFPLGLAEYHLLLQAIDAGFGVRDRESLAQLCRNIWVKSESDEQIFQNYFDQIIPHQLEQVFLQNQNETETAYLTNTNSIKDQRENQNPRRHKISRILWLSLLGITPCVVGIVFYLSKPNEPSRLEFSNDTFSFQYPNIIQKKVASIEVTRTGSSYGIVSAKLNSGKKCSSNQLENSSLINDDSLVSDSDLPPVIFKDGDSGQRPFLIPINDYSKKVDSSKEIRITLCLTNPQGKVKLGDRYRAVLIISPPISIDGSIFELLLIAATCIVLLLVTWRVWQMRHSQDSEEETLISDAYTNLPKTLLSPEVIRTMADEIQVAYAIKQSHNPISELFPLVVNDLPITHRQMKQGWRYLRQFSREGSPTELDLEATIQQVAQQGILLHPVFVPQRTNRTELLLLIDRDGSMVPFHHLAQQLVDTAMRGGRFSRVQVYYFHNCPNEYLYRDPYHLEAELIDDCLLNLPKGKTVCIIFSDAGAARSGFTSKRRRLTKFFLNELEQYVRHIAWLNPVPRKRWKNTTANDIAAIVPMFEVNRQDFYRAIDLLRGRHQAFREALRSYD